MSQQVTLTTNTSVDIYYRNSFSYTIGKEYNQCDCPD